MCFLFHLTGSMRGNRPYDTDLSVSCQIPNRQVCLITLCYCGHMTDMAVPETQLRNAAKISARDRVLQTASALFYQHGIHTVGIDRIIAESGVAKMTFYRHFPSKARLVAAYLAQKEQCWQQLLGAITSEPSQTPLERVLAVFDAL